MNILVPAKTFLAGEYAVLIGKPCLVISHSPFFEFGSSGVLPHPESPAGQYLAVNNVKATDSILKLLTQPLIGSGGFGASSAEFLVQWLSSHKNLDADRLWWTECFTDFRSLNLPGNPSGADLVSQILGGLVEFSPSLAIAKKLQWGFKDLSFLIFKTGIKINTHDHLKNLQKEELNQLSSPLNAILESFPSSSTQKFLDGVNEYRDTLLRLKLEASSTTKIIEDLKSDSKVLAVKGCGALGADSFVVIAKAEDRESLISKISSIATYVASEKNFSQGVAWS